MTIVASPRGRQNVLDSDVFCWNELPELLAADELFESSGLDVQRITEASLACASKQEDDEFEDEDDEDDDDEDDDDIDDDDEEVESEDEVVVVTRYEPFAAQMSYINTTSVSNDDDDYGW